LPKLFQISLRWFSSPREKELHPKALLPVGTALLRLHDVTKGSQLKIDRQLTKLDNFATTTADRQRPTVAAGRPASSP